MTVAATRARAKAAGSKAVVSRSRNSSRPMTVILKAKVTTAAGSISSGWTRPAAPTASRVAEKKATASARPKAAPPPRGEGAGKERRGGRDPKARAQRPVGAAGVPGRAERDRRGGRGGQGG